MIRVNNYCRRVEEETEETSQVLSLHGLVSTSKQPDGKHHVLLQVYGADLFLQSTGSSVHLAKRKMILRLRSDLWWWCEGIERLNNA